jgi:hypothetical protein
MELACALILGGSITLVLVVVMFCAIATLIRNYMLSSLAERLIGEANDFPGTKHTRMGSGGKRAGREPLNYNQR